MRHLAPRQRADGVVVFERPEFKESGEVLELAETERVDQPFVLPVPFTVGNHGGAQ
jgi:hypothetical protein